MQQEKEAFLHFAKWGAGLGLWGLNSDGMWLWSPVLLSAGRRLVVVLAAWEATPKPPDQCMHLPACCYFNIPGYKMPDLIHLCFWSSIPACAIGGQSQNMNLPLLKQNLVLCHKNTRKQLFQSSAFISAAICSGRGIHSFCLAGGSHPAMERCCSGFIIFQDEKAFMQTFWITSHHVTNSCHHPS